MTRSDEEGYGAMDPIAQWRDAEWLGEEEMNRCGRQMAVCLGASGVVMLRRKAKMRV